MTLFIDSTFRTSCLQSDKIDNENEEQIDEHMDEKGWPEGISFIGYISEQYPR